MHINTFGTDFRHLMCLKSEHTKVRSLNFYCTHTESNIFFQIRMCLQNNRMSITLIQSRGQLAQRESVRLSIQQSEFDSASRQKFLSPYGRKCATSIYLNISCENRRHHLLEKESKFSLTLWVKGECSPNRNCLYEACA